MAHSTVSVHINAKIISFLAQEAWRVRYRSMKMCVVVFSSKWQESPMRQSPAPALSQPIRVVCTPHTKKKLAEHLAPSQVQLFLISPCVLFSPLRTQRVPVVVTPTRQVASPEASRSLKAYSRSRITHGGLNAHRRARVNNTSLRQHVSLPHCLAARPKATEARPRPGSLQR